MFRRISAHGHVKAALLLPAILSFYFQLISFQTNSQIYSTQQLISITDNGSWVEIPVQVSGLAIATSADFGIESVCLNVQHPAVRELTLILQAPDGTKVTLISGVGWDGSDLVNTCLDDSGPNLEYASAPITGSFRSMLPLGHFNNGLNPNGTWKLLCRDALINNTGTFQDITLKFSSTPAAPFSFTESHLPIVLINSGTSGISDYFKSEIHMQIIDNGPGQINYPNQQNFVYDGKIMAEYQGWSSTNSPKKNIDFNLGDAANPKVESALGGLPEENDWLFKAEFTDRTLMKNSLSYDTYRKMGRWAPRTRFCEMIIDGQYMGVYTLMEKVKRDGNRLDISKLTAQDNSGDELTGGYIIEMNPTGAQPAWYSAFPPINDATTSYNVEFKYVYPRSNEITDSQKDYIKNFIDEFESMLNGSSFNDPVIGYKSKINVDSFIDFLILNEFTGNYDSYGRSTYLYKEKNTKGGKLHMGPPWDYDRTFGYDFPDTTGWVWEITNWYWPFPFWWSKLWTDPEFKNRVACRWRSYRADVLSEQNLVKRIDSLDNILTDAWSRNEKTWPDPNSVPRVNHINALKQFISGRLAWIDQELNSSQLVLPEVVLVTDTTLCSGEIFDGSQPGNYFYNWRPGPETAQIAFPESGRYILEVSDSAGCFTRKEVNATVLKPSAEFSADALGGTNNWVLSAVDQTAENYQWDFGDGNSASGNQVSHTYTSNNLYDVTLAVTDQTGCRNTYAQSIRVNSTNIELDVVQVYPNPAEQEIIIVADESIYGTRCWLTDLSGGLITQGRLVGVNTRIDMSSLASGTYIVQIEGQPHKAKRIVKP
jgi:subtilisin-like proprotein convertase family protein